MKSLTPSALQDCPRARSEGLESESIENEVLIYDRTNQRAHCLNRPAALLWGYCDGKTPVATMALRLAADLGGAADDEIVLFGLRQLSERALLEQPVPACQDVVTSRRQLLLRRGSVAVRMVPVVVSSLSAAAAVHGNKSDTLIVRGGAVLWKGSAILLLSSDRRGGTSQLVAALVRCGATLIADGQVRFEESARIRVPAGAPAAESAVESADVALIVATTYQQGALWKPAVLRGSRATLPILDRAALMSGSLRHVMQLAARLAPRVTTLSGLRPDADQVAPEILNFFESLMDAEVSGGVEKGGTRVRTQPAATAVVSPSAGDLEESASSEVVRRLLLQHPAILMLRWHGRFGNRMHQYAYAVTYARRNGYRFWLPANWEGTYLFEQQHHSVLPPGRLRTILGRAPHLDPSERRLRAVHAVVPEAVQIQPQDPHQNFSRAGATVVFDDMCAYHPSIFSAMSTAYLRSVFEFSTAIKQLDFFKRLEDRQGKYDIAHLRRDDISSPTFNQTHQQGYSVISKRSYEVAFAKFGFDPAAIEWVSDDYSGKWHLDRPPTRRGGWIYPEGSEVLPDVVFDWLPDFLRLYFARTIFRANSSFSWWAAFLSPCARVFSPVVDRRHIYGLDGLEEIDVEFVEGNHPHWMFNYADICIGP